MNVIGVQELRHRIGKIIRDVQQRQEVYIITYNGRPAAILRAWPEESPADSPANAESAELSGVYDEFSAFPADPAAAEESRLDSLTWGQWHTMSQAQRLAMLNALRAQNDGG